MAELDPVQVFVAPMNTSGVPDMITGSSATIAYGEIRLTNDVDVVLTLVPCKARALLSAIPDGEFYRPPLEDVLEEAVRAERGHSNLLHHKTGCRADHCIRSSDLLEQWSFRNRRCVMRGELPVWFAPSELLNVRKVEFFREGGGAITKHLNDIRGVLACTDVDRAFIEEHFTRLGLQEPWLVCQPEAF
jgi:hypothetical protein